MQHNTKKTKEKRRMWQLLVLFFDLRLCSEAQTQFLCELNNLGRKFPVGHDVIDWGSLMMVKLSREAVSPQSETSSAEWTHWLLGTFAVKRVGFLQGSSDHQSTKSISLSLYFSVNEQGCFCKREKLCLLHVAQRYQIIPLGNLLLLSNKRFFSLENVNSIKTFLSTFFYFF